MENNKYIFTSFNDEPLFLFKKIHFLSVFRSVGSGTIKKFILKIILIISYATGRTSDTSPFFSTIQIFGINLDFIRDRVSTALKAEVDIEKIIWNREYSRKRAYMTVKERVSQRSYFVKLGFTDDSNLSYKREYSALLQVQKIFENIRTPSPVSLISNSTFTAIITDTLPSDSKLDYFDWELYKHDFSKTTPSSPVNGHNIHKLTWFDYANKNLPRDLIQTFNQKYHSTVFLTHFVHGDLGSENTLISDGSLIIIDWERSFPDAPYLTDQIAHYIDARNADFSLSGFESMFINKNEADAIFALFFLAAMEFKPAIQLITRYL